MKYKYAEFNRFCVKMPVDAVRDCHHQGSCDEDVEHWEKVIKIKASADDIREELRGYGAWNDNELSDDRQNRRRILWLAAGNIQEESE